MKNHIKCLSIIILLTFVFVTISCNNELKTEPTYYTVTFDSDGGTSVPSQTIESGKTAIEPRSPAKSGYTFDDWYKGENIFDFSTPITADITLLARWTKIQNTENNSIDNDNQENNNPEENNNKIDEDKTPPAEVSNFTALSNHKRIILNWTNPSDEDFTSVEIICETVEKNSIEPQIIQGNPSEQKTYTISNLENGKEYLITIKTIDTNNNKSTGLTKTASPKESKLNLEVSLPNDNKDTLILTNDKATINVSISSTDQILKAVWKQGNLYDAEALLSDESATILITDSNTVSFTVTENGFYTIAVKNAEGITECIQTQIKTIDKTPLSEVNNLSTEGDGQNIYVTWENPSPQNKYDSPLKNVVVSYVYNDDESDVANGEIVLGTGITTATIPIANDKTEKDFVNISVKVIDEVGNINEGKSIKGFCYKYITITNDNINERILSITENITIIAIGKINVSQTAGALRQLRDIKQNIKVELDLTKTEAITYIGGYSSDGFRDCTNLTSIKLPDSVINIANYAFSNCTSLTNITIPDNVTTIGEHAFSNCSGLTEIIIPDSITSIGEYTFSNCSGLTEITLPNNITCIGFYAFKDCNNLTTITIPSSITKIEYGAFPELTSVNYTGTIEQWCSIIFGGKLSSAYDLYINNQKVTNIIISNVISKICNYAFAGCASITKITIPDSVTNIGNAAFYLCKNLIQINIPNSVVSIDELAFGDCTNLTSITIPESTTTIGESAFYNCYNLTKLIIPDNVITVGECAFSNCSGLTEITINGNTTFNKSFYSDSYNYSNEDYPNLKKVTFSNSITTTFPFNNCEEICIKDNVTSIPDLSDQTKLKKINYLGTLEKWCRINIEDCTWCPWNEENVTMYFNDEILSGPITIPDGITSIGNYTFYDQPGITSVTIPENVTSIGKKAFVKCSNLATITLPYGITHIGEYAFSECSKLSSLSIPDTVTSIGNYAFNYCSNLTTFTLPNNETELGAYIFMGCSNLHSITIPENMTTIGWKSFSCSYFSNIIIPDTVTTIDDYAFANVNGLTNLTIGNNVTNIGKHAFEFCSTLTSVLIPDSVTKLSEGIFYGCGSLEEITIPSSVTNIEVDVFYRHYTYEGPKIYYTGTLIQWCNINRTSFGTTYDLYINGVKLTNLVLSNNISKINQCAFYQCLSLTNVTLANETITNLTNIGAAAFYGCNNLTSVILPDSITTIEQRTFASCINLTSITIPNSIISLEEFAFGGCEKLQTITIPDSVIKIGKRAFSTCSKLSGVTIGNNVSIIDDQAFYSCLVYQVIRIPASVTYIGINAFQNCGYNTGITVTYNNRTNNWYDSSNNLIGKDPCSYINKNGHDFCYSEKYVAE